MKQFIVIFLFLLTLTVSAQLPVLEIGETLPQSNHKMECATSEKTSDLASLKGENGLLVIFSCNTCPFVVAWENRYPMVNDWAKNNHVGFALLNSNFLKRDNDDSWEAMKAHAKKLNYQWPYLIDNESEVANAFGAQTTPHVFLFDKDLKLVYKGAIDDNHKEVSAVKEPYLKNALVSLGNGTEITVKESRPLGCSIKRK